MFNTLEDDELIEVKNTLIKFANGEKSALQNAWHNSEWPSETWNRFAKKDIIGFTETSNRKGILRIFSLIEGFCRGSGDSSFCTSLIVQFLLCNPIKNKYFPNYKSNFNDITCFALTEKQGGSSPFDMTTTLRAKKNQINGVKWHITNAPACDNILTFGKDKKTNKFFLGILPSDQKGIRITQLEAEGMKNSPVGTIHMLNAQCEDFVVSSKAVKLAIGNAFILERLGVGFAAVGTIEHHLEDLIAYIKNRKVSDQRIYKHQYIQKRITDIKINLDTLKALLRLTVQFYIERRDITSLASQVKLKAVENVREFCKNAIFCYGSYGIQKEVGLMRVLNDSMGGSIAGGTEEIHRNMIFAKMIRQYR